MPKNWAGTYEYAAPIVRPESLDDLRRIVTAGGRVRALGTRHSFTDIPDTTGTLVEVPALPEFYELDEEAQTLTVAAGIRYGVIAEWLHERGWAFRNMGSLPHINIAGATQTGTHGSGDGNGVLTTGVRALRYVGADGDLHEVRRGDPDFEALAVGLGAFGIIVAVTVDLVPSYRVRQDIYRGVSWDAALADYRGISGAAYSVSVFSRWEDESIGFVWTKTRLDRDDDAVPDTILDGVRITDGESPLNGDNVTEIGSPGPWMLRLPHFRLDREPSFGDEIQTEYFVPMASMPEALRAVKALGDDIRPHLVVTELRSAAADDFWLSGAYQQDAGIIHFTWMNHAEEVTALLPAIESALEPFGARPHWGKLHAFDRAGIERVHPRLGDARAVYERLDPDGVFSNAHLERLGVREAR